MQSAKRTFFKVKKDTAELRNWSITKEQIGHQLKKHYRACMTDELPPRLRALLKKLDEEQPEQSPV